MDSPPPPFVIGKQRPSEETRKLDRQEHVLKPEKRLYTKLSKVK